MSVIKYLGGLKQEDHKFKAILGLLYNLCPKMPNQSQKRKEKKPKFTRAVSKWAKVRSSC